MFASMTTMLWRLVPWKNKLHNSRLKKLLLSALLVVVLMRLTYQSWNHQVRHALMSFSNPTLNDPFTIEPVFQFLHYQFANLNFSTNTSKNISGFETEILPDVVHYIQLENPYLDFITLISIMSVLRHHQPKLLMIHSDQQQLRGKYWQKVLDLNSSQSVTTILLNRIRRPKYIFHRKLSSVYHASDIARIRVLKKYGGIYLDNDVYVVKSLHGFRKFEFALGWPSNQFLGTQVLICHKNARFLKLWLESYRNYKPHLWYYNAGEYPTTNILIPASYLVHRVETEFGVDNLSNILYKQYYPFWQKDYFTIHLLARHRSYIVSNQEYIPYFNEYNIKEYNYTFGEMARLVYFGSKSLVQQ